MRGVVMYGPGDVRVGEREDPRIVASTDAIIRLSHGCICGSDLWPWRGIDTVSTTTPMGYEYVGVTAGIGPDPREIPSTIATTLYLEAP